MNRFKYVLLGCLLLLTACQSDPQDGPMPPSPAGGFAFSLLCDGFEQGSTRSEQPSRAGYDKVAFSVIDAEGFAVDGLKGVYDPATSVLRLEGLREGDYRLLLLGIRGDEQADGVTIHTLRTIGDEWLSFPEDLRSPLQAEYFYSQTPFSVVATAGADGTELTVTGDREPVQQRIIGRTDFTFAYNNPYVETALLTQRVTLTAPRFRTGMTGDGAFTGTGTGSDLTLPLDGTTSYLFPPTVTDEPLCGEVEVTTRDYRGSNVRRSYGFTLRQVAPNRIGTILTRVEHPDDRSAVAFVTETALESIGLAYILQDDEPHTVYTDRTQRSFNTAAPLQVTTTDEGKLHVRFYSPRELTDVLIRARIPSTASLPLPTSTANCRLPCAVFLRVRPRVPFWKPDRSTRRRWPRPSSKSCRATPSGPNSRPSSTAGTSALPSTAATRRSPTEALRATGWASVPSTAAKRWPCFSTSPT